MTKRTHIRAIGATDSGSTFEDAAGAGITAPEPDTGPDETQAVVDWDYEEIAGPEGVRGSTIAAFLAILAVAGWTGFFAWTNRDAALAGASPQVWIGWITTWAIPVLLVVCLWMLALRTSTSEGRRFGDVANVLSAESRRLEERLGIINRELSLAREFLTAQSRDLEYLGRSAGERISEHASTLQALVADNARQVESIASVSITALENMTRLRDSLPVIATSARDVTNNIGGAGRTARDQLGELVSGFERLNDFGRASERQVASLRERVDEALAAFSAQADQLEVITSERFAILRDESEAFRSELDSREVDSLAAISARAERLRAELADAQIAAHEEHDAAVEALATRLATLRDDGSALARELADAQDSVAETWTNQVDALRMRLEQAIAEVAEIDQRALDNANGKLATLAAEAQALDGRLVERNRVFEEAVAEKRRRVERAEEEELNQLAARLENFDIAIAERREAQSRYVAQLQSEADALAMRVAGLGETFAVVGNQGREAHDALSDGIGSLGARLAETREALDGTDMAVAALTDASVRLLELIQASAKQTRDELPAAMQASDARLSEIEARAETVRALLGDAELAGARLTDAMVGADGSSRAVIEAVEAFEERLAGLAGTQDERLSKLRGDLAAFGQDSDAIARRTQDELAAALLTLRGSITDAFAALEAGQDERVKRMVEQIGTKSADVLSQALARDTQQVLASLDESAKRSTEAGREAAIQLRDQLVKVNELASNLETRVSQARERAEEQVDNDFSRRVALITESLNSNAIDVAKALSTEVTDTAWASYLRGDRGIFTRRAVRLLENTEAREIAELYDADRDFRDHVNRYIHDFESMLRTMLSTRDGHALSVTMLSSDMGKLYVVLAQALERLRN